MIELPPTVSMSSDASLDDEELKSLISSINSRYLYWSDVKYRRPHGMSESELWSKVKSIRRLTDIEIWKEHHIHFALTNTMQRLCHELDMNFGGS